MNRPPVVDPRLTSLLADFFPTVCQVAAKTIVGENPLGEEIEEWTVVPGLDGLRAAFAPVFPRHDDEVRADQLTTATMARFVELAGAYTEITTAMRLVSGSDTWNILSAAIDSQSVLTRLMVEQVTI